jgi:hypothetical protein
MLRILYLWESTGLMAAVISNLLKIACICLTYDSYGRDYHE